jgi:hypothetical protein
LAPWACGTCGHINRRTLLKFAGLSGLSWLSPVAQQLAGQTPAERKGRPAQSIIVLWMAGGPSQLETFDPHPGTKIAAGTTAIETRAAGVRIASGLPLLAEQMDSISVVRNVVSLEGDHERATYTVKTGFRPDPTLVHPAIGAVVCHELPEGIAEIPRHISILPNQWYGRGGYLGQRYDAFRAYNTRGGLPDVQPRTEAGEFESRLSSLEVVDREFERGRLRDLDQQRTLHRQTIDRAVTMMSSKQLTAFDISESPKDVREDFGDSEFGRACLAAMRLTEVGVRCVEVTLDGWDSHFDNHGIHNRLLRQLDPGFAALVKHLKLRDRLRDTLIVCGGEFGRTPNVNPAEGRDHWPHGFSVALAGGTLRGGAVLGETDPEGSRLSMEQGTPVEHVHATLLSALGIQHDKELETPVGRPIKLSEGRPISALLS